MPPVSADRPTGPPDTDKFPPNTTFPPFANALTALVVFRIKTASVI